MGREQRRREDKKNKKKFKNSNINYDDSINLKYAVKVVLSVVVALMALYFVVVVFVTGEVKFFNNSESSSEVNDSSEVSSTSNKILASATFRQSPEVYYVCYYDFKEDAEQIESVIGSVSDVSVYKVDTGDSLNSNYVTEESGNKEVSDIGNLKVKSPTVIKIDNDQVVGYYEGLDNIVMALGN